MTKTTTCTKRWTDIPFAHRQPNHKGHCRHIHGHDLAFEFEFVASEKDECGFVVDFGGLKKLKQWLDDTFDHQLVLNGSDPLFTQLDAAQRLTGRPVVAVPDCSAEGLAEYVAKESNRILQELTGHRVAVRRVTVFEDSKNSATCEVVQ
jgi:6-pyruvoyltetrahydropterin/6-carboxytetrahydropterin synthase